MLGSTLQNFFSFCCSIISDSSSTDDAICFWCNSPFLRINSEEVAARRLFTARILSNERKFSPDDVVPCGNHTGGTAALDRLNCHLSRTFRPGVDRVVKSDKQSKFHDCVTFHIFSAARRRSAGGLGHSRPTSEGGEQWLLGFVHDEPAALQTDLGSNFIL